MALCKFLKGDSARISTDITPFHEGYIYVTKDGYMYIDMNLGTADTPNNQRIKLNAGDAETILGASLSDVLNASDEEIPTSQAVIDKLTEYALATQVEALNSAIDSKANASDLAEVQMGLGKFNTNLSWNADETVYTETWTYNGSSYKQVLTEVSDTQWTKQLYIDDVLKGTWTMTLDETNMTANTVYVAS